MMGTRTCRVGLAATSTFGKTLTLQYYTVWLLILLLAVYKVLY